MSFRNGKTWSASAEPTAGSSTFDIRLSNSKIGSPRSRRIPRRRTASGGARQTSILLLLLLFTITPLSCNPSNDNTDTGELICSDDDPFDIEQCPDSYPDLECTVYVDGDVESSGDGWSWNSAVKTVQEGVDLAYCGAEIAGICSEWEVWVKKGTYYIHKGCREHSVRMREKTVLLGGFDGTESNEWERDWEVNETVLNGRDSADGENQVYHVVRGSDLATIDGFTITGGRADDEGTQSIDGGGGGMINYYASPTVSHCIFENNYAVFGGAMDNYHSTSSTSVTVRNSVFRNNTGRCGGAISAERTSLVILDSEIFGNFAVSGGGIGFGTESEGRIEGSEVRENSASQVGAGIAVVSSSDVEITECTLTDNQCVLNGGALYISDSAATLRASVLTRNTGSWGGGIVVERGSADLEDVGLYENSASYAGGGIFVYSSEVNANRLTLELNTAEWGGGFYNNISDSVITNSLFFSNTAVFKSDSTNEDEGTGGGLHSAGANTSLVNCTFAGNAASLGGQAIHSAEYSDPNAGNQLYEDATNIINTILWGNGTEEIGLNNAVPVVTYSDVEGGYTGDGNIDADPLFVNSAGGDLHLQAGSPCIGAADPEAAPKTDIEGNPRDDEPDMGAYEF